MSVGERIQSAMKKRGISQNRLAKMAQISQSGLSTIISGAVSPKEVTLQAIANALDCPVSELMGESSPNVFQLIRQTVPIVGDIACGTPITAEENIEGYADLPENVHADFALRCKGDSMEPTFCNGDLVLIRKQPEVETGQIAAVMVDNEATLKRFHRNGDTIVLLADNPKYQPIIIPQEMCSKLVVCGLAVGFVRMF